MSSLNLIPEDYRQGIQLQRLVRSFIMLCALVLGAIALAKGVLSYLIWRENAHVVRLEQQEQASQQNKTKAEEYRQQKQVTEQQLAALKELRGGDRTTAFIKAIDHAYTEGVWFDHVRFIRRSHTGTLDNVPSAANLGVVVVPNNAETAQSLEIKHGAEILGHAMSHTVLADFMRKLGMEASVADLRLIDTGTRTYANRQVIDFNLALQLNETVDEKHSEKALATP